MWTASDVTRILRRDLSCDRLVVKLDHDRGRWCVYERTRRATGARRIRWSFGDDGTATPYGKCTIREIVEHDALVYVHSTLEGEYLPLNPHVMVAALRAQDRWAHKGDLAGAMIQRVKDARARKKKQHSDHFADLAADSRSMFVKAADEMGL